LDKKLRIIAVVPIYFPSVDLEENIKSYIDYVDLVIIINNSVEDLPELKNIYFSSNKIILHNPSYNLGLSKSYNFALNFALNNNFDYLLIMDQDSKFISNFIWEDLIYLYENKKIALISAASSLDRSDYLNGYDNSYYERKIIMSSGSFLSIQAARVIGNFDELFFIDEIDHDYSLRCYHKNYINISSYLIHLNHMVGEEHIVKFPFCLIKKQIILHKPFRYYHIFKNSRIMISRYMIIEPIFVCNKFVYLIKLLLKIIFFYPNKYSYFSYIFKSFKK
jgi:rhamnosyltransferase